MYIIAMEGFHLKIGLQFTNEENIQLFFAEFLYKGKLLILISITSNFHAGGSLKSHLLPHVILFQLELYIWPGMSVEYAGIEYIHCIYIVTLSECGRSMFGLHTTAM